MKNILLVVLFCCNLIIAQQKSKTNIPIIKEGPKTNVPIIKEEDDLLPINSNEPNPNDLLDIVVNIPKPKQSNAGKEIYNEIGLNGNFSFNKKITFSTYSSEGDFTSHFYLNTKNGYSMQDTEGFRMMVKESLEGEMTQIKTANNDFYQYTKSSEGNFVMKMGSGQSMVVHDIQTADLSKTFFKTFKKTGNKVGKTGGNKYPRVEYSGTFEGEKMSIWLSSPQDILIDTKFTYSLSGYWGLGFIASPSKRTYMITGITGKGFSVFMNDISNTTKTFSGKGYKPMGAMFAKAMQQNQSSISEEETAMQQAINEETDPTLKALKQKEFEMYKKQKAKLLKDAGQFAETSDMADLPFVKDASQEKPTGDYYDMLILMLDQSVREHQLGLKEAQENNDAKSIKRYNCLINCTSNEKNRLEKVKTQHIKILQQHKNDEELRDEKLNQLMMNEGQPIACNCD